MMRRLTIARICTALLGLPLGWVAYLWLDVTRIESLAHADDLVFVYRGYAAMLIALVLVCFNRQIVNGAVWISERMYRWISMLTVLGVIWMEAAMHMLNIPHVEGWWMPIIGGGSALSASMAWRKIKRK